MYQNYNRTFSTQENNMVFMGAVGNSDIINWYTWYKPTTAKFIQILCVGGGSGGGGGGASAAGVSGAGGSGGGGSPYETVCIPAILLPSVLFIKPGFGGLGGTGQVQGGAAATDGAAGRASYVSIRPNTTNQNCVAVSGGNSTSTGKLASGATNGAASGTTIVSTASIHPLASLGILAQSAAGQTSGAGGTTGSGGNITPMTTGNIVSSGSGGGGVNAGTTTAAGGQILNSGFLGNAFSGGAAGGGRGRDGYDFTGNLGDMDLPFVTTGGTGGGSNTSTLTGGAGGNGGPGSGGGGGGGTNGAGSVGGAGGNGGPGFVVISWF